MKKISFIIIALLAALVSFVSCDSEGRVIPVDNVILNHVVLSANIGETVTLAAKILPDNATDKTVTWKSSDETIATVSNGEITALKAGEVKITATAGEKTATCILLVIDPDTRKVPLTLTFTKGGTLKYTYSDLYIFTPLYYSINGGEQYEFDLEHGLGVEAGDRVCLFADRSGAEPGHYLTIECFDCECTVSGNVMSLVSRYGFENMLAIPFDNAFTQLFFRNEGISIDPNNPLVLPAVSLRKECYKQMFAYCKNLTSAPDLPARYLAQSCYEDMFEGCTSLTKAPILPAKLLASCCYKEMFEDCSSLKEAPVLPAEYLVGDCYNKMFSGCSSLEVAPNLPATKLAANCYNGMFYGCSNLISAPELPATTLAASCYADMFFGCINLPTAPVLSATKLEEACYEGMFSYCEKLTALPTLPATEMADNCYNHMFQYTKIDTVPSGYLTSIKKLANSCFYGMFLGCQNLESLPALPNAKLEPYCYGAMFDTCTFKDVPKNYLPAKELATGCYYGMFADNPNLETTPDLPAPVMVDECYECMFYKSPKVKAITCLALEGIQAPQATTLWLDSVAPGGTFTRKEGSNWHHGGETGGIPDGWTEVVVP